MIRRDAGAHWLLFTQADHAAVAATLAAHVGGRRFMPITARRASVLSAVAGHDAGWRSHDAHPTLDGRGRPLDVFDASHAVAMAAWAASTADTTAAAGPYAGLVVSLHSLALSIATVGAAGRRGVDLTDTHTVFAVNQFQHREIERQEALRLAVGLPTDIPLTHGLADPGNNAGDDQLAHAFRLLQAMELISLCLCCTLPPADQSGEVLPHPSASPTRLSVARDAAGAVRVRPWPFDVARLDLSIPARRLPARPFGDVTEFRTAHAAAEVVRVGLSVRP